MIKVIWVILVTLMFLKVSSCGTEAQFEGVERADSTVVVADSEDPIQQPSPSVVIHVPEEPRNPMGMGPTKIMESFIASTQRSQGKKVDVVFMVDSSGSMVEEMTFLKENIDRFIEKFTAMDIADYQILIVGDMELPEFNNPKIDHVDWIVNSHDALKKYLFLADSEAGEETINRLNLRRDAAQEIIIISDDNSNMSAGDFSRKIRERGFDKIAVNGFVGYNIGEINENCNVMNIGTVYMELASTYFKGYLRDICDEDWGNLLEDLGEYITENLLQTEYPISKKIDPEMPILVKIEGRLLEKDNFSIDFENNLLIFKQAAAPRKGASFEVIYFTLESE